MKRLLCIVLLMVLFSVPALAEGIDLSSMPLGELLALRIALNSEIAARFENESTQIFSGEYVVGEDIRAGMYVLYADMPAAKYITIEISWPDKSHEKTFEQIKINESFYLNLEDGCILHLDGIQTAHLNAIVAPEWAP